MRLSSSPLNSAFLPDHPYVLQLVRHETEAWNNKFNRRYDTIRIQRIKLHHFPCISVCLICRFPLWFLRTRCVTRSSMSTFHPSPFRFCEDSADTSDVRSSLHVSTTEDLIRISMEGPELEAFDPTPAVVKWFSSGQRSRRPNFAYSCWFMGLAGFRMIALMLY